MRRPTVAVANGLPFYSLEAPARCALERTVNTVIQLNEKTRIVLYP